MLKEIGFFEDRKIHNQELRSLQDLGYHENVQIVLTWKYLKTFVFLWASKSCYVVWSFILNSNSVEKKINFQKS